VPRLAAKIVLPSKLGQFACDYPDIVLDVTTDDSRLDIVAKGFDAGIQFGEFIEKDMIAVRVSRDQRPVIVGSPGYFKTHPKPKSPRDLLSHRCINFRHGSTDVYRWEFQKGKKSLSVAVRGPLIVDDLEIVISAAVDGVGLAFMAEENSPASCEWGAGAGAGRLVPTLPWLFHLLSQSAATASSTFGFDQCPSPVNQMPA
jgi:DNA-binding transcriptional LysR family regulator